MKVHEENLVSFQANEQYNKLVLKSHFPNSFLRQNRQFYPRPQATGLLKLRKPEPKPKTNPNPNPNPTYPTNPTEP